MRKRQERVGCLLRVFAFKASGLALRLVGLAKPALMQNASAASQCMDM